MKITYYVYELFAKKVRGSNILDVENFEEDVIDVLDDLTKESAVDRKEDILEQKKIIYLNSYEYNKTSHILLLEFKSAKYASVRKVVDTDTLIEKAGKKKGIKDGDEETTRMIIKFDDDSLSKEATCIIQINSNGVSIKKIQDYLNAKIKKYHSDKKDLIWYRIFTYNKVSDDFLRALLATKRISVVKLSVDNEDVEVSEFKNFSGLNDINDTIDVVFKPAGRGLSISKSTVEKFYKMYNKNDGKVKRIYIKAEDFENNPLTFDTEKIVEKIKTEVNDTITGEPLDTDVIRLLKQYIQNY